MIKKQTKNKPGVYGWIWYQDDITKEPPIVRLMKAEDIPKRIWIPHLENSERSWD